MGSVRDGTGSAGTRGRRHEPRDVGSVLEVEVIGGHHEVVAHERARRSGRGPRWARRRGAGGVEAGQRALVPRRHRRGRRDDPGIDGDREAHGLPELRGEHLHQGLPQLLLEHVLREVVRRCDQGGAVEQTQRPGQAHEPLLLRRDTDAVEGLESSVPDGREAVVGHRHRSRPFVAARGRPRRPHGCPHTVNRWWRGGVTAGTRTPARGIDVELRIAPRGPGSLGVSRGPGLEHQRTIACSAPFWAWSEAAY